MIDATMLQFQDLHLTWIQTNGEILKKDLRMFGIDGPKEKLVEITSMRICRDIKRSSMTKISETEFLNLCYFYFYFSVGW